MSATVTKLPVAKRVATKRVVAKAPSAKAIRTDKRARTVGVALLGIFAAGMALSLSHQAHGVASATTVAPWEGWATAVEIDCGFIAAKLVPYFCRDNAERAAVERFTKPLAVACLILCAWFNASGYAGFVPAGFFKSCIDVTLGCFVPGVMLAMSQVARILILAK